MTVPDPGSVQALDEAPARHQPRGLAANISALATSQAITWTATLAWTLVVPRLLGPTQMGVLITALATTAILGVVLGLPNRDYMAREMVSDPLGAPRLLGTSLALRLGLAPCFFLIIVAYARAIDLGADARHVLYLCAGVTVCTLLAEPALAAFQASERMEHLAVYEILNKTLQAVGGIALVLVGLGVVGLSLFNLVVAAALVVHTLWRVRRLVTIDWHTDPRRMWFVVRASAPYWTFGVFFMIYLWIDAVMLGLLTPAPVVGWYGVATKLFTTSMFVPVIFATAWLPRLVRAFERGPEHLAVAARAPIQTVFVLSLPACVVTAVGAVDVLPLLYGERYVQAGPVLAILALCFPLMYLNIMLYQTLIAARRPTAWMRLMALATVVNPLLNLVLIQETQDRYANGAIGAAWSLVLTELLVTAGGVAIVGRRVLDRETTWRMGRAVLAAVVMWAGMVLADPLGLLVAVPLGLAIFLLAVLILRVITVDQLLATASSLPVIGRRTPAAPDHERVP